MALSNLFLLPIAGKLKQRAREQWFHHALMLEAIISIDRGEHPLVLEEKIESFLMHCDDARPANAEQYNAEPYAEQPQYQTAAEW